MHFPSISSVMMAAACFLGIALVRPVRSEEPKKVPAQTSRDPQKPHAAIERGLSYLEKDAVKWRKERGCATCHHGTMTVWALSEAKKQGHAVDAQNLADMLDWTKERLVPRLGKPRDPRPGWNLVSTAAIYLGAMSQSLPILSRDEFHQIADH